jgi:hypothetical protein
VATLSTLTKLALGALLLGALMGGCYTCLYVRHDGYHLNDDGSLNQQAVERQFVTATAGLSLLWTLVFTALLLVVKLALWAEGKFKD